MGLRLLLSLRCVFDNKLTPFISGNGFGCNVMDSYFSLLNLSFVENYHTSIFTTLGKQSMIIRLSNPINRNRSAAKISKFMSSSKYAIFKKCKMTFSLSLCATNEGVLNSVPKK